MRSSHVLTATLVAGLVAGAIGVLCAGTCGTQRARPTSELVVFDVHDDEGRALTWDQFRRVQSAGRGDVGISDMIVDRRTLEVRRAWPLHDVDGRPALERPAGDVTLALPWPTSAGYSQVLLDLPPPGRYVFTVLLARQAVRELQRQRAVRPGGAESQELVAARAQALRLLEQSERASSRRVQGALGARAYDAAVRAQLLLLQDHGVRYAAQHRRPGWPAWGVTFDEVRPQHDDVGSVRSLFAGGRSDGWVRLVFDAHEPPETYTAKVSAVRAAGLRVLGQVLDSSQMAEVDLPAWERRVRDYVDELAEVDAWEVGNEVNGAWVGEDVVEKASFAARYVKANTRARTVLTLHWQLGEEDPEHSTFTWSRRHLTPEVMADVDEVGLSIYPGEHPLGVSFDRVLQTLHRQLPGTAIGVLELGYGSPDMERTWWWGDPVDPLAGQAAVARWYGSAVLGYPFAAGGTYWWYYLQEAAVPGPLRTAVGELHAAVVGLRSGRPEG